MWKYLIHLSRIDSKIKKYPLTSTWYRWVERFRQVTLGWAFWVNKSILLMKMFNFWRNVLIKGLKYTILFPYKSFATKVNDWIKHLSINWNLKEKIHNTQIQKRKWLPIIYSCLKLLQIHMNKDIIETLEEHLKK